MAKPVKRKRPAATKRKTTKAAGPSKLALSGWIVAAGLGLAWAVPQTGLWPAKSSASPASSIERHAEAPRPERIGSKPSVEEPRHDEIKDIVRAAAEVVPVSRPKAPRPVVATLLLPARTEVPTPLPRVRMPKPEIAAAISAPVVSLPKPILSKKPARPPVSVGTQTASARSALPIRKFPYVTAETVATVEDLRTLRVLGGQGDWKKVEIAKSGQVGWLQLRPYRPEVRRIRPAPNGVSAIKPVSLPSAPLPGHPVEQAAR